MLNELRDLPHNALVKTFASRQAEKRKAFDRLDALDNLPSNLVTYLQGLRTIWSLPKGMEKILDQGVALAKQQTVRVMFARNFDIAVIADVTGLTEAQVGAIVAGDSSI